MFEMYISLSYARNILLKDSVAYLLRYYLLEILSAGFLICFYDFMHLCSQLRHRHTVKSSMIIKSGWGEI